MAALPTPLRRNPEAASHELADQDGAVVLHTETARYYGLNRIGTLVWSLIDGTRTQADIVGELTQSVKAPPDQVEADVARFVARLRERGLLL